MTLNQSIPQFFCDDCRGHGDEPIPENPLFNRVHVTADIMVAGTSINRAMAEAEAQALVKRAIDGAGGTLSLHTVRSVLGRLTMPPRPGREEREPARGEWRPLKQ